MKAGSKVIPAFQYQSEKEGGQGGEKQQQQQGGEEEENFLDETSIHGLKYLHKRLTISSNCIYLSISLTESGLSGCSGYWLVCLALPVRFI